MLASRRSKTWHAKSASHTPSQMVRSSCVGKIEMVEAKRNTPSVLRITIVLHEALINSIYQFPPTTGLANQNDLNVLYRISKVSGSNNSCLRHTLYLSPRSFSLCVGRKAPILAPVQHRTEMMKGIWILLRGCRKTASSTVQKVVVNRINSVLPKRCLGFLLVVRTPSVGNSLLDS